MRRFTLVLLLVLVIVGAVTGAWSFKGRLNDKHIAKFNEDADNLLMGLQQYKEFIGSYPPGSNVEISRALLGQTEKKVLILVIRKNALSAKGEIVDSWGTPLQFYFSNNGILIRSAGPNKAFEDNKTSGGDDLFRTN